MSSHSDYIKEAEKYFLSLAGSGIMLSSVDYNIIADWKKRDIPLEIVFKGINRAFEDNKRRYGDNNTSLKNMKQCAKFVENTIIEFSPVIGRSNESKLTPESPDLELFVQKLNDYINSEGSEHQKRYYRSLKDNMLSANDESLNASFLKVEEECLEQFFLTLEQEEKDEINSKAREILGQRARHMTDAAIEESICSFRNEILINKYNLASLSAITEQS